jgi:hypothetical protein
MEGSGRSLTYSGICLEGLRKINKNLSQDYQSPSRDLNPIPPENETGAYQPITTFY